MVRRCSTAKSRRSRNPAVHATSRSRSTAARRMASAACCRTAVSWRGPTIRIASSRSSSQPARTRKSFSIASSRAARVSGGSSSCHRRCIRSSSNASARKVSSQGCPAMGKMFVVFKREYLERVRSKWFLVATLLGPVFLGLITVLPIALASKTKSSEQLSNVIIIDATGTDLGSRVQQTLAQTTPQAPPPKLRSVKLERVPAEERRATSEVMGHEALGYMVLDANTSAGKEMRYAGRNATALIDVDNIERIVRQNLLALRLEREGIDASRVAALTSVKLDAKTEKITDKGKEGASGIAS